jgi:hypothetical protein
MEYVILENLYTTTNINSNPFIDQDKSKIKFIKISTQGSLRTSKGLYNP